MFRTAMSGAGASGSGGESTVTMIV